MLKTFFLNVFKKKSLAEVWFEVRDVRSEVREVRFEVRKWFARGLVGVWVGKMTQSNARVRHF